MLRLTNFYQGGNQHNTRIHPSWGEWKSWYSSSDYLEKSKRWFQYNRIIGANPKYDNYTCNLIKAKRWYQYYFCKCLWYWSTPPGAPWLREEPHPAVFWLPRRHLQNVEILLQNHIFTFLLLCERCNLIFQGDGYGERVLQHHICQYSGARGNICRCLLLQWRQVKKTKTNNCKMTPTIILYKFRFEER